MLSLPGSFLAPCQPCQQRLICAMKRCSLVLFSLCAVAVACPNFPEMDLCTTTSAAETVEANKGMVASTWIGLLMPILSPRSPMVATIGLAMLTWKASAATCDDVRTFYQAQSCCGQPTQALDFQEPIILFFH